MASEFVIGEKVFNGRAVINIVDMDATTITCQLPDGSTKVYSKTDPVIKKVAIVDEPK